MSAQRGGGSFWARSLLRHQVPSGWFLGEDNARTPPQEAHGRGKPHPTEPSMAPLLVPHRGGGGAAHFWLLSTTDGRPSKLACLSHPGISRPFQAAKQPAAHSSTCSRQGHRAPGQFVLLPISQSCLRFLPAMPLPLAAPWPRHCRGLRSVPAVQSTVEELPPFAFPTGFLSCCGCLWATSAPISRLCAFCFFTCTHGGL